MVRKHNLQFGEHTKRIRKKQHYEFMSTILEDFEDTKGVTRNPKSKNKEQHRGQKDKQWSTKHCIEIWSAYLRFDALEYYNIKRTLCRFH